MDAIPTFDFFFSETIKHLDVFSSCFIYPSHEFCHKFSDQFIRLRDMTSLLVGAGKPFLSKSTCVLSFLTIKIKFVDKMKQSDNLSVILHVRHKKLTVISVFS